MRMRANASVFIARMMLSTPLCPPLPRAKTILSVPSGKSRSSWTTRRFFAAFGLFTNAVTALPERFIIVSGNTSVAFPFSIAPLLTSAFAFLLKTKSSKPSCFARNSTALRPALCRVLSYSFSGFPSPTTTSAIAGMVTQLTLSERVRQKWGLDLAERPGARPFLSHLLAKTCTVCDFKYNASMSDTWKGLLKDLFTLAFLIVVVVIPIRVFIVSPFIVDGDSMSPTFENLDYLVVDELVYTFKAPARGDVIVFRYPENPSIFYIKRVIGVPGEMVSIDHGIITITTENGVKFALTEP